MSLTGLDISTVLACLIVIFLLAQWASREKGCRQQSAQDYFPAGRALPWRVIGTLLIAANMSAGQIIGMSSANDAIAPMASSTDISWNETVTVAESNAGWGRMARLPDRRWLAVTTRFDGGTDTTLSVAISDVRARNWQPLSKVTEPGRKLDNGELFVLPDGRVLLAMRSLIDGQSYRLNVYRSTDGGGSWNFLATLDRNETPAGRTDRGLWEPTLSLLADGTLSVLYADETFADGTPSYNQVISQRLSSDGGQTWGEKRIIVAEPDGGALRPGMPVMARLQDGRFLLVFETCGADPQCPVSFKFSANGLDWPQDLGEPLPPHNCGPYVLSTQEGRVLVTSCQNEIGWSEDGAQSWRVNDRPAWSFGFRHSWPALYQIAPGKIAVINNDDPGAVRIRFGTFQRAPSAQPSD